jgi:hypothetical protein
MRKSSLLIALIILALGLVGTSLSTLYEKNEYIGSPLSPPETFKMSYGFPLGWHGYSLLIGRTIVLPQFLHPAYWFSLESLLLDGVFWFAISLFASAVTMKSVQMLLKTIASKVVVTYFCASASFLVVGLCLYLSTYQDLGLRLYVFGTFLVAATFYQSLAGEKKARAKVI